MADPLTGLLSDSDQAMVTEYLGREVPVSTRGQASLPVGGAPVTGGAGPVAPGGTGVTAEPASAAAGIGGRGGKPSDVPGLANIGLKATRALQRMLGGPDPQTVPSASLLEDAPRGAPVYDVPSRGRAPAPTFAVPPSEVPAELGGVGEPVGLGVAPGAAPGATAAAAPFDYESFFSNYAGGYAPYLAAAMTVPGIVSRAEGRESAGEQATRDIVDVAGALLAVPTFGLSSGLGNVLQYTISDIFGEPHVPHKIREAQGERGVAGSLRSILDPLQAAQTPEEIWAAFAPTTEENFRTRRGTSSAAGYPLLASGVPMTQENLTKALAAGDPEALSFAFQAGVDPGMLTQANEALNQATRQQNALIQAAQAGEPMAKQILAERAAAYKAQQQAAAEAGEKTQRATEESIRQAQDELMRGR